MPVPVCNDCRVNPAGWLPSDYTAGRAPWTTNSAYCLDCASKPGKRIFRLPKSDWTETDHAQYAERDRIQNVRYLATVARLKDASRTR